MEVQKTGMIKSYKVVVLCYMLSEAMENWLELIAQVEATSYFHKFPTAEQYRLSADFNDMRRYRKIKYYDEKKL